MATENAQTTDTYAGMDTAAIAADIGASLFAKSTPAEPAIPDNPLADDIAASKPAAEKPVVTDPAIDKPPVGDPPVADAPGVVPGENSEPLALPKSWKKELSPEWEKASPGLKKYVHEREAQVMRGINQYQAGYQAWDNLTKPFQPILEANPDVNPIVLMQGLMATHLQLISPTVPAADKQKMVVNLLSSYGISLEPGTGPSADSALLERLARTEAALQQMSAADKRRQAVSQQEGINTFKKQVDAFEADPKNEYFAEVGTDILRFIQNGAADSLASAYELACWANPAVRAKMLAKQQAAPAPSAQKPRGKNGQFLNVESDVDTKKIAVKPGTMDDTINSVVAKHYPKH